MRSLWAEGEVRPGEVVSTRSGCGILADAGIVPLIKPAGIRLVREMSPGRIRIGCWAGRLVRLRKLWKLGMLHWGTPLTSGWLPGSRRTFRCTWMLMMLFPLPSWSLFFGGVCVALLQGDGFLYRGLWEGWGPGQGYSWGGVPGEVG